jgi:O-antigen/teichoic acid export membrane protein
MVQEGRIRTQNIKKQAIYSTFTRVVSMLLSFITVPITLNYLDTEKYGIWVTISSVVAWIVYFDLGLGHGMKNKVAEALAKGNESAAKTFVSTSYLAIGVFSALVMLGVVVASIFFDWQRIFNTKILTDSELWLVFVIVVMFMLGNFVLSLINSIANACQKSSISEFGQLFISLLWFCTVLSLSYISKGQLLYLAVGNGIATILVNIAISVYFFKINPSLTPNIKYVDFSRIKDVMNLGLKFFIIQLAVLIIYSTDNMIITQVLGPEHVAAYSIVFKLFSTITIANGILTSNLWPAYTEAYTKKDYAWIKSTMKKLNLLMIPIILVVIALIFSTKTIVSVWLGKNLDLGYPLIIFMGIYTVISIWNIIYAYFLNAIGIVNLQMYAAVAAGVVNIPLSIFFAKNLAMGSAGVIMGTVVSLSVISIVCPLQTWYIFKTQMKN